MILENDSKIRSKEKEIVFMCLLTIFSFSSPLATSSRQRARAIFENKKEKYEENFLLAQFSCE
jgi:hypothetical protein